MSYKKYEMWFSCLEEDQRLAFKNVFTGKHGIYFSTYFLYVMSWEMYANFSSEKLKARDYS